MLFLLWPHTFFYSAAQMLLMMWSAGWTRLRNVAVAIVAELQCMLAHYCCCPHQSPSTYTQSWFCAQFCTLRGNIFFYWIGQMMENIALRILANLYTNFNYYFNVSLAATQNSMHRIHSISYFFVNVIWINSTNFMHYNGRYGRGMK